MEFIGMLKFLLGNSISSLSIDFSPTFFYIFFRLMQNTIQEGKNGNIL